MNYGIICYILSHLILFEGGFLLLPAAVSLIYGETDVAFIFLAVAAGCFILGLLGRFKKPKNTTFFTQEGLVIASLGWIILGLIGALPFVLTGEIPNYVDAVFETVSGFTTTGASILPDCGFLQRGTLFWRSFTHWMGGMGVLVLLISILPLSGSYNVFLMRAESPGPDADKMTPRVKNSAMILYKIYLAITVLEMACLMLAGLTLYEASILTFSTVGTGGFALLASSIGSYSIAVQVIITIFMLACGTNFMAYFLIISGKWKNAFRHQEIHVFFGIVFGTAILITINIMDRFDNIFMAFHTALFQVASIISTTGFSTADFNVWPMFSKSLILMVMIIGACAGSTGGGLKVSRLMILVKSAQNSIVTACHPNRVRPTHVNCKALDADAVRRVSRYFVIYALVIMASFFIVSLDNQSFETSFTAVLTTINNVGPALGMVGPTGSFADFSILSKIVLTFDMLAGRLELYPMLALFAPSTWRRY